MDFNRFKYIAQQENKKIFRKIICKPKLLYKAYARECDMSDWLKIYKSNKNFALYMHESLPFDIFTGPFQINIEKHRYPIQKEEFELFCQNLDYFLTDQWHINELTIDHCCFSHKTRNSIKKLINLKEMTITHLYGSIYPMHLKSLRNLHIKGDTDNPSDETEIQILDTLPNLKKLTLSDLHLNILSIDPFKRIRINNLILNNIDLDTDVTIKDLNYMLNSTNKLTLNDTHILFHQILLHSCFANTIKIHSLTLSVPEFPSGCFLDYSALCYAKKLKTIKITFSLHKARVYVIFTQFLSISKRHSKANWIFDLEFPSKSSHHLISIQERGYDNYEDYVNSIRFKMNEITQNYGHINYTFKYKSDY